MDLKCHIYNYVHDIIYARYKFWCTREFDAHMIFVEEARFQWNHVITMNSYSQLFIALKTQCIKGHYETNSHFKILVAVVCCTYVHAHNLCIFKYILKWIYLSFPNKLIFSYRIVSLINIRLSHSPGNCSKRESSLGMYYMRFSSVRRKMLERDLEKFWDLDLAVFFAMVDCILIMPTETKIQPIEWQFLAVLAAQCIVYTWADHWLTDSLRLRSHKTNQPK